MALIKCPECGKEVSDRALSCPSCGFPLIKNDKICPECNTMVPTDADTCPTCGYPFSNSSFNHTKNTKSNESVDNKNKILALVAVIVGIIFIISGIKTLTSDDIKFYKDHLQECIDAQSEVDSLSYGSFGGTYKSISNDYDRLIAYDKEKITGLTIQGMSFVGAGIIFVVCSFLLFKGILTVFKEKTDGINQVS